MVTHSRTLAWRIPGTGEPGGLPSMGSHRVGHDLSDLAAAAAVGKNPLKKWSNPYSQQESEMQYLGAVSKTTEWSWFVSKANHSTSQ